jgi:hypothetical protein
MSAPRRRSRLEAAQARLTDAGGIVVGERRLKPDIILPSGICTCKKPEWMLDGYGRAMGCGNCIRDPPAWLAGWVFLGGTDENDDVEIYREAQRIVAERKAAKKRKRAKGAPE